MGFFRCGFSARGGFCTYPDLKDTEDPVTWRTGETVIQTKRRVRTRQIP